MSTILISLALLYVRPLPPSSWLLIFRTAGKSPQYYEIYKYKAVIGISLIFMAVDALGGLFSDLSLAFKQDFDVIACVSYSAAAVRKAMIL